jgi:hypothetical protein
MSAKERMGESELADMLGSVVQDLTNFAMPVFRAIAHGEKLPRYWRAGQGWANS